MIPSISEKSNWVKKLPDKIIYLRGENNVMHPPIWEYVIFSPKDSCSYNGMMKCHKSTLPFLDTNFDGPVLAIDYLYTTKRGGGYGKALLNFAKKLSEQTGCSGQIILKSVGRFLPMSVPHLFYRKNGFTTLDKKTDKKMDKFIKKNQRASQRDFSDMFMYFPEKKQKSLIEKFAEKQKKYLLFFNNILHN